jgi:hypothetical protein
MSSLARVSANEYDPCLLNNPAIAETNVRGYTFFPFMKYVKRIPFQPSKR